MATPAQVLANRNNSLYSSGPLTAEGKATSSQNSRKHGLTSKQIVLPGEDPAEFDALRENLLEDYAPANETERTLVEEVAAGSWRLARARRHETAILKKLIGDSEAPEAAFAELFVEKPKEIERLLRYITTIERAYYRALNKLEKLQKERIKEERESGMFSTWTDSISTPDPAIGFVSQNRDRGALDLSEAHRKSASVIPYSYGSGNDSRVETQACS
jgi:hypothetical protein